jgi:hypothetical protein
MRSGTESGQIHRTENKEKKKHKLIRNKRLNNLLYRRSFKNWQNIVVVLPDCKILEVGLCRSFSVSFFFSYLKISIAALVFFVNF